MSPTWHRAMTNRLLAKRRYGAFFGTDLDAKLREHGTVVCGTIDHSAAVTDDPRRLDFEVIFLRDTGGTFEQPANGCGTMSAEGVQRSTLIVLANTTGHVMTTAEFVRTAKK